MDSTDEDLLAVIRDVKRARPEHGTPKDDLTAAYRINRTYMIHFYGITITADFLLHEKQKSEDQVLAYVATGLKGQDWKQFLNARVKDDLENTESMVAPPPVEYLSRDIRRVRSPISPVAAEPATDEDPFRFNAGDFLRLVPRIEAHELWNSVLAMENDRLRDESQGPINARLVAFVALLWRKNILQNVKDPGAVPYDAAERFVKHDKSYISKVPSNLQIRAALHALEAVAFLKQVRKADRKAGLCNAYKLLNQSQWFPASTDPDPKQ